MDQCYFLGFYALPGGTCAQWFSGTATFLAVTVALGAHFYSEYRQRRTEARQDSAEIAGISMLLRSLLNDVDANAYLFHHGCRSFALWGKKYVISRPMAAVRAVHFDMLNKYQADVLLRYEKGKLAEDIDELISKANLNNLGIEDYARMRSEFVPISEKYVGVKIDEEIDEEGEEGKILKRKLTPLSASAEYFLGVTREVLKLAISISERFNVFCELYKMLDRYKVQTEKYSKRLERFESKEKELGSAE